VEQLAITQIPLGPIQTNCYLVRLASRADVVVVDPGDQADDLLRHLHDDGLTVAAIVITHVHFDHVGAVHELAQATGAPVYIHHIEAPALADPAAYAAPGFPVVTPHVADHTVDDGDTVDAAGLTFTVMHVPGHSPGHVVYVVAQPGDAAALVCLCGDVIFAGSVGRTDLPMADHDTLMRSIDRLVAELPADTILAPGHGQTTVLREEIERNPFLVGRPAR
jgi:hydroxyacylglutathione hydrolase